MNGLLWRLSYPAFWSLVDRLLAHADQADYMIIVERVPAHPVGAEHYWFGLLVQKGAKSWCYTSGLPPDFTWAEQERYESKRYGVWGRVRANSEAQTLIHMIEDAHLLEESGDALSIWDRGLAVEASPWLIHVYRADGARALRMMTDHPMLHPDVVFGSRELSHLLDLFESGGPEPAELQSAGLHALQLQAQQRRKVLEEYKDSFPMRLVLNGLLRIIYAEWPSSCVLREGKGTPVLREKSSRAGRGRTAVVAQRLGGGFEARPGVAAAPQAQWRQSESRTGRRAVVAPK